MIGLRLPVPFFFEKSSGISLLSQIEVNEIGKKARQILAVHEFHKIEISTSKPTSLFHLTQFYIKYNF